MDIIKLDFETYYDDDYTLSKMTTEAYVRDPRFEVHGCAVQMPGPIAPLGWHNAEQFAELTKIIDWSRCAVMCHHAHFDGLILAHHYGIRPAVWLDTLSMARHVLGNHVRVGLESLAKHFNLAPKSVPYNAFRGKHWHELDVQTQQQVADGACHDVELMGQIFNYMAAGYNSPTTRPMEAFPAEEYRIIDATVRMFTEPRIVGDTDMLAEVWTAERDERAALLAELQVTLEDLRSDVTFASLLQAEGVECSTKITASDNEKYAFAKTDQFMRDLIEDDDPRVAMLAEARLASKSTLEQTRSERLGWMSTRGAMCVYINYCGAHTTRDSGGDKLNWQNFTRGSKLRKAMQAPAGKLVAVVDAAQIECRMLNYLAGQHDIVQAFREKRDIYSELATKFYGFQVDKSKPKERGTGKQLELSCLGPDTLVLTSNGTKPITEVALNDRIWDGLEWCTHSGLMDRGKRDVLRVLDNLWVTPEHLFLCENMWTPARTLLNESTALRVLATASVNLPSLGIWLRILAVCERMLCAALAEHLSTALTHGTHTKGLQRAATRALKKRQGTGQKSTMATQTFVQTTRTVADCLLGSVLSLRAVNLTGIATTEHAVYAFMSAGAKELRADALFSSTLWGCPAGTSLNWSWTGATQIKGMFQETCASLRTKTTQKTAALSSPLNAQLPTYDLALCGPRNRFTVVTAAGPAIVHNCGYGAGGPTIVATAKKGTYGPPVFLSDAEGERAKDVYRSSHAEVKRYWYAAREWIKGMAGFIGGQWGPLAIECNADLGTRRIVLPNGAHLIYDTLEWYRDEDKAESYYRIKTRKGWVKLYGAKLVENVIQALARLHMMQVALKCIDVGLWPWLRNHDELAFLVDDNAYAEPTLAWLCEQMRTPPAWLGADCPLDAEGILAERYEK